MNDMNNPKAEFLSSSAENLMERFVICFNITSRKYQKSELLIEEEIAPALIHTAGLAAFNFLTYLAGHYALEGQEQHFFDDYQALFAKHCELVVAQIKEHREQGDQLIITDETIVND